jgi:hypothetical protein
MANTDQAERATAWVAPTFIERWPARFPWMLRFEDIFWWIFEGILKGSKRIFRVSA